MEVAKEKELVPELRFKEFDEGWKRKKLGDISNFSKGKGISKADINENGKLSCIRYGELYTRYTEVIDEVYSRTDVSPNQLVLSEENDVIIPASGETQIDIATASCVLNAGIALSGDLNIIKSKVNGVFLSYYLNNKRKLDIAKLSQGISVVHIYASQLKTLKINIPKEKEQQKIASFLSKVDEKIALLTKKKELLEEYKKGVTQKIFKQEIRFKDENGNDFPKWEKRKLGELSERITRKNKIDNQNVLTISAQHGLISQLEYFNKSVSAKNLKNYYLLNRNEFAYNKSYSKGYPMGAIKRLSRYDEGVVSTLYICFRFKDSVSLAYMEQYFESGLQNKEIEKVAQEGARNHGLLNIGLSDFFEIDIRVPVKSEQDKIASFLSSLDKKITAVDNQLSLAKEWKKGLLQKMFV